MWKDYIRLILLNTIGIYNRVFVNKSLDIKIAISTVKGYSQDTIPNLVASLKVQQLSRESILVFEGGYEEYERVDYEDYICFKVPHNSFDLTALISIYELKLYADYWLLLHDTLEIGAKFKRKLLSANVKGYDAIALRPYPSMNIGIYSRECLINHKNYLEDFKNTDYSQEGLLKAKERGAIEEDYLFKNTLNKGFINRQYIFKEYHQDDVEYKGRQRRMEYYPQLDITKFKANFIGMKTDWVINL